MIEVIFRQRLIQEKKQRLLFCTEGRSLLVLEMRLFFTLINAFLYIKISLGEKRKRRKERKNKKKKKI